MIHFHRSHSECKFYALNVVIPSGGGTREFFAPNSDWCSLAKNRVSKDHTNISKPKGSYLAEYFNEHLIFAALITFMVTLLVIIQSSSPRTRHEQSGSVFVHCASTIKLSIIQPACTSWLIKMMISTPSRATWFCLVLWFGAERVRKPWLTKVIFP